MPYSTVRAKRSKGSRDNPAYHSWMALRRRCRDKAFRGYKHYGGRGITVCDRWFNSFQAFIDDLGERPKGASIERRNNYRGYWCGKCTQCIANEWPENCEWADLSAQANNKRCSVFYEHEGKRLTRAQLARAIGADYTLLRDRVDRRGWNPVDAAVPATKPIKYTINGISRTTGEWAKATGLSVETIQSRVKRGCQNESIIAPPGLIAKNARILIIDGVSLRLCDWARRVGIPRDRIKGRLQHGWTEKEAVFGR